MMSRPINPTPIMYVDDYLEAINERLVVTRNYGCVDNPYVAVIPNCFIQTPTYSALARGIGDSFETAVLALMKGLRAQTVLIEQAVGEKKRLTVPDVMFIFPTPTGKLQ